MEPRALLRFLFEAAVDAASPKPAWFAGLRPSKGRTVVVGAGKAAAAMARALERACSFPLEGLVVTRYGHALPTERIEVVEAAHPIPDAAGLAAAERILDRVRDLSEDDQVVALISGGGSALLTLPAPGITLEDKQAVVRDLLRSGASIGEINAVRKSLSAIKGGRLLRAAEPARVVTYVLSDVPGDDPALVASGPTIEDATPPGEAIAVVERYRLDVPPAVRRHLEASFQASSPPDKRRESEIVVVGSAQRSLDAAADAARALGLETYVLSDAVEGEAREVAKVHAALCRQIADREQPFRSPCVVLSGGETTVTVRGAGRGGRNVEFLAAFAQAMKGHPRVYALAADTDGVDGSEETAGAFVDPTTERRAGRALARALAENDAHALFETLGDRLVTGPTHTNVNDFRAFLIQRR